VGAPLHIRYLGRLPYHQAWELQKTLVDQRLAGDIPDTLLLLEHDPVITLGRSGKRDSLLVDADELSRRGIELVHSDRGGDITWHGPGQIIGYAILDLRDGHRDVRRFVQGLEQTVIDTCAEHGLTAERLDGAPGVWLRDAPWGDRKVAAIGARFTRWITHHGFALNVNPNLEGFRLIVPCGLHGKAVTSLEAELGHKVPMGAVMERLAHHFARVFEREVG
jgi:lipoyl(octanoyl) transferase